MRWPGQLQPWFLQMNTSFPNWNLWQVVKVFFLAPSTLILIYWNGWLVSATETTLMSVLFNYRVNLSCHPNGNLSTAAKTKVAGGLACQRAFNRRLCEQKARTFWKADILQVVVDAWMILQAENNFNLLEIVDKKDKKQNKKQTTAASMMLRYQVLLWCISVIIVLG